MMTAEQLKESILQLAMQGKLVEQRLEEGTGEELYKEIQKDKKNLIKDGSIKAGKKYNAISEEEIMFDIPETWVWTRLSDIVFNRGQKKPENVFSYIDIGSIDNVHQKLKDEENIIEAENAPSRARKIVAIGDVIYSTVRPYLHNMCIIDREFSHEPIASTGFAAMTCHEGLYNRYLFYYLLSPDFDRYANDTENSKGVAYPAINDQKLYKALVPLPPLAEQKRIVAKIEELMPFVEQYATTSTRLNTLNASFPEMMKKSILQEAVQGKLVPQDSNDEPASLLLKKIAEEKKKFIKDGRIKAGKKYNSISEEEIAFDIPETWKWARLSDGVFNRGQKKPENTFSYIDIGSIDNVHQKLNDEENIIKPENAPSRARKIVASGDVIYSTVRPYLHNMCIIDREFSHEPIASTGFAAMTCHEGLYNKYLFYFLLSPDFDRYANDTENSKGVAYPAINDQKLYKALVPIPPLNEQKRIVAKIEELMSFVDDLKN